jgi:surface polysaccharide O-acyltransferase-like enzyme
MQTETTRSPVSRQLWADWIRNIGILLVILGHVSSLVVQRFQDFRVETWMAGNVYNVLARSCVPLLFMVSGALLLPHQESIRDFYRKRFRKVIFPFLFWSVFYILLKESFTGYTIVNAVKAVVKIIVTRPAEYHLWFMYELFAIYLFTPVLRGIVNNAKEETLWYLTAIWFLFGPVQRFLEFQLRFDSIFDLGYLTGYVGYFLLGYLLTRIRITKAMLWAAAAVYLAAGAYTAYITFHYSDIAGKLVDYFQYLLGLNIVLLASALYLLLKAWGEKIFSTPHPRLAKLAVGLTSASFGMYLIHVFWLTLLVDPQKYSHFLPASAVQFFQKIAVSPLAGNPIYTIPVTTLVVFIISWIVIAVLQKIPYVRSLVA